VPAEHGQGVGRHHRHPATPAPNGLSVPGNGNATAGYLDGLQVGSSLAPDLAAALADVTSGDSDQAATGAHVESLGWLPTWRLV
jgi:hypothetical protein